MNLATPENLEIVDHLLTTTRSVRKRLDLDRPVERQVIEQCLEIAAQAPSGSNRQGWHFVVVTDAEKKRFIAERSGEAVGYFQYTLLEPGHVGADQFLANGDQLSKGLGTRCLAAFVDLIRAQAAPERNSVDPDPSNTRAIRFYEKCGFVPVPARSSATVHFMTRAV